MNDTKNILPRIGDGVYLTKDVAQILHLPYAKVRYWMNSFWHGYTFGTDRQKAVNFYTMMEFYIYYHLREQNISAKKIKELHEWLAKQFDTHYPFASIRISTHQKRMFYEIGNFLMIGDKKMQPTIREFLEPHLNKIEFGDILARRYFPLGKEHQSVVVDPLHQFGQPVINGTNIQTATIHKMYEAGETKHNICILYDISEKDVTDALDYYSKSA
jgi:uncharacterized protein (DUF433 family)